MQVENGNENPAIENEELDTPKQVIESKEPESDTDSEYDDGGLPEDGDEAVDEMVEYEEGGKKYSLPKSIADKLNLIPAAEADAPPESPLTPDELKEANELAQKVGQVRNQYGDIQRQLGEYSRVDWQQLAAQDKELHDQHWQNYQLLKDRLSEHEKWLSTADQKMQGWGEKAKSHREAVTMHWAKTNIPNFTPKLDREIRDFARKELGFPDQQVADSLSPQIYKALHLALVGHRTLAKPAPKPPVNDPKPAQKVAGRQSAPRGPSDNQDIDSWMKARNAQVAAGR